MLVVQGKPHGKSLRFPRGEFIFGRGPECHVQPNSPSVSRQHCLLRITADGVLIRDLASTNGTLVNGTRLIGERPLADGDLVQVGPLVLQLKCRSGSPTVHNLQPFGDTAEIPASPT
jgi:pSer/pThr/pTyr-binding forkhead associated (FHA) protein